MHFYFYNSYLFIRHIYRDVLDIPYIQFHRMFQS